MSIVRFEPFRELEEMNHRLNRVFGLSPWARAPLEAQNASMKSFDWVPTVDIAETPEEFHITAELPDIKREDIKLSVDARVLRMEGERKHEKEEKNKKYHRVERSYGSFLRTFALPDNVDESKVQAEFKDGILHVRLAKRGKVDVQPTEVKIA